MAIMAVSSAIVGKLTPYLAKVPFVADLPIGIKVFVVASLLAMAARYVPQINTLTGNPIDLIAQIFVATFGGTLGLVNGVNNIFQTTRSVQAMKLRLAGTTSA